MNLVKIKNYLETIKLTPFEWIPVDWTNGEVKSDAVDEAYLVNGARKKLFNPIIATTWCKAITEQKVKYLSLLTALFTSAVGNLVKVSLSGKMRLHKQDATYNPLP